MHQPSLHRALIALALLGLSGAASAQTAPPLEIGRLHEDDPSRTVIRSELVPAAPIERGTTVPASATVQRGSTVPGSATVQRGTTVPGSATVQRGTTVPGSATVQRGSTVPGSAIVQRGSTVPRGGSGYARRYDDYGDYVRRYDHHDVYSGHEAAYRHEFDCDSVGNRFKRCPAPSGPVSLIRRNSRSACDYGRDWGHDGSSVWVDNGCRARFGVD